MERPPRGQKTRLEENLLEKRTRREWSRQEQATRKVGKLLQKQDILKMEIHRPVKIREWKEILARGTRREENRQKEREVRREKICQGKEIPERNLRQKTAPIAMEFFRGILNKLY